MKKKSNKNYKWNKREEKLEEKRRKGRAFYLLTKNLI